MKKYHTSKLGLASFFALLVQFFHADWREIKNTLGFGNKNYYAFTMQALLRLTVDLVALQIPGE
jgi:hypothetical protein